MRAVKIELPCAGSCPGWQLTGAGLRLALPAGRPGDLVGLAGHRYPRDGVDHSVTARQTRTALAHAA